MIEMQVTFEGEQTFDVGFDNGEEFSCQMEGIIESNYDGPYQVTPSEEEQTLSTSGKTLAGNVVIAPIPSNYGKLTWSGTTLTVS